MSWTRPQDLRAQVQKLWDSGVLLSKLAASATETAGIFPKRLVLKSPSSIDMSNRFDEVRAWIAELRTTPYCRIEIREFSHRVLGANSVPDAVWIDSLDDALALIGKRRDANRFKVLVDLSRESQPAILDYMENGRYGFCNWQSSGNVCLTS